MDRVIVSLSVGNMSLRLPTGIGDMNVTGFHI